LEVSKAFNYFPGLFYQLIGRKPKGQKKSRQFWESDGFSYFGFILTGAAGAAAGTFRLWQTGGDIKALSLHGCHIINGYGLNFIEKFFFHHKRESPIIERFIFISQLIQS
jgi:hypothetical protein